MNQPSRAKREAKEVLLNLKVRAKLDVKGSSQAPDRKSNPHVPDLPRTAVSVKTLSYSFENATNVFAGAENPLTILKSQSYLRNSQKLLNFVKIFSEKKTFYGDSETMSVRFVHPRVTHR